MESKSPIMTATYVSDKSLLRRTIDSLFELITSLKQQLIIPTSELYLILDEALTNAMEHGNKWDSHKKVTVTTTIDEKFMKIKISDQGCGYDCDAIHFDKAHPLEQKRGRGIAIISRLCKMKRNRKGNILTLYLERVQTSAQA